uniref:DNA-directed RNA polymerase subunit n=1 Tax=Schistocephalus solidus TaxID=70667 RepID=A0A0X3PF39_SCHSO
MDILVDGQINSYGFSFYSPEEIKKLSVIEITSNATFDKFTNRGIDGGLHDMALGPCSERDACGHCGLDYVQCPGHFGHISFAKPAYNPLFFDLVVRLLKSFCFSCFKICNVDCLSAALQLLGLPDILLPSKPKPNDLEELRSCSPFELRKAAIRAMSMRQRLPCRNCSERAWISRHINHQQIVMRPVSDLRNSRYTANSKSKFDGDADHEPGELECWAAIEAQLLGDKSTSKTVTTFEEGSAIYAGMDFQDLSEAVRDQLKRLADNKQKESFAQPELIRDMFRCLWMQEASLLRILMPCLHVASTKMRYPTDIFFLEVMPISPSFCRWPRFVGGYAYEHPTTAIFSRIIKRAIALRQIVDYMEEMNLTGNNLPVKASQLRATSKTALDDVTPDVIGHRIQLANVPMTAERACTALHVSIVFLQAAINAVYDATTSTLPVGFENRDKSITILPGLKQRLEKKQGLFRMHMMGKRVNYACRSVISPDPNLRVHEVGVPLFIATQLTFPEPVTALNVDRLRKLVTAGPDNYPGARSIQTPDGVKLILPGSKDEIHRKRRLNLAQRLVPPQPDLHNGAPTIVNRHLQDGDLLVMNRQPTLHRPSMQAHRVRIIRSPGAKTLRLHYAICKAYNADFDGDEMNGHFPQTIQAKAELAHIAAVPYQYLAPKDGSPLGGLIQDHVIAAVKLTIRDRFFDREEYLDLVYSALYASIGEAGSLPDVILLKPAILWPTRLWTGKQVVSTLLMNITPPGLPHINAHIEGKRTKIELWAGAPFARAKLLSDVDLVICGGYLVSGMLEKAHIGSAAGGLVHFVHEAYGPHAASQLLSGISRMSDRFLKIVSFTMSLADIALREKADRDRRRRFRRLQDLGLCAFADAFGVPHGELSEERVKCLYRRAHFAAQSDEVYGGKLAALDCAMKERLKASQDAVCDAAIPSGLYVPFPSNSLQLMVHIGAKGGMVNAQQMSVALGQIELEGRRVPLMLSGRTLPSFPPYDIRPRAGGMCTHRFLTSMPPQELFFHSMAGRDGLVDTACKTSRSGYLQRSLIKHLEDLSVQYDGTVRDSGGGIIQFRYGDDGLDVCQSSFLKSTGIHFFADNAELLSERWKCPDDPDLCKRMIDANPLAPSLAHEVDEVAVKRMGVLQKSVSENKLASIRRRRQLAAERLAAVPRDSCSEAPCRLAEDLRTIVTAKIIQGQAPPGDPVGLLAAQSVGEPSTQMTLNTFHFAGRGEMNVTLGIPRLREVLMSGSAVISTPCMEVPILPTAAARTKVEHIARSFYKLRLTEVVKLPLGIGVDYGSDTCTLTFHLQPPSAYEARTNVKPSRIIRFFERVFLPSLAKRLEVELRDQGKSTQIKSFALKALARQQMATSKGEGEAEDEEGSGPRKMTDRGEWNEDDGAEAVRRRRLEAEDEPVGEADGAEVDLDEDDDEVAELREIGLDPEAIKDDAADEDSNWPFTEEPPATESTAKKTSTLSTKNRTDADDNKVPVPSTSTAGVAKSMNVEENKTEEIEDVELDRNEDDAVEELLPPEDHGINEEESALPEMDPKRVEFVKGLHIRFSDYAYDTHRSPSWVQIKICMFDPKDGRISTDLRTLVQRILNASVVSAVPGITKAFVDKSDPKNWVFRIEGINVMELMRYPDVFALNKLYTNNVLLMQQHYGIEAARACLQREVSGVFGHYGIYVNPRHLGLVTDYLTKTGIYRAFNRRTMDFHPSPMQRVTFETATGVLKTVIQEDLVETMVSPSGSLIPGQLVHGYGTTCFDLLSRLTV